jgi:FkbM family methyltransferase
MFLDNLLPTYIGALASPKCFVHRILYPEMVSFGLLANLSKMKSRGVINDIDSIWDIGANHGQFAFMANKVWPNLPIYSFEPDPDSYQKLVANFNRFSIKGNTYSYALSDKTESKEFIRYAEGVNNSLLTATSTLQKPVDKIQVECTTLDSFSKKIPDFRAAFLKIDVQGFELAVINGAKNFLSRCKYVQIEVSFSPNYEGGAHAGEVMLAMRDLGFECIEILDLLRDKKSTNKLIEADLLFKNTQLVMP